jgi:hypothetical protein
MARSSSAAKGSEYPHLLLQSVVYMLWLLKLINTTEALAVNFLPKILDRHRFGGGLKESIFTGLRFYYAGPLQRPGSSLKLRDAIESYGRGGRLESRESAFGGTGNMAWTCCWCRPSRE